MKVIGIIGGMGSGKSTVVQMLSEVANCYIINADHMGHAVLKKGNLAYRPVIETFGEQILAEGGEIDRGLLGAIVFSNPKALQQLNKISHPLIYKMVKAEIELALKKGVYDYIIVDAALLIEIKLIELVDEVWGVYVPLETQVERVMLRNGWSKEEATRRIRAQLPWTDIKKVIHVEINNASVIGHTKEQIINLLKHKIKGL